MEQGDGRSCATNKVLWKLFLSGPLWCACVGEEMEVIVGLFLIEALICHHLGYVIKGKQYLQAALCGQVVVSFMGAFGLP